jgi:signal transduction histidine kinase
MVVMTPVLIVLSLLQLLIGLVVLFESRRSRQTHQKLFVLLLAVLLAFTVTTIILTYVDAHADVSNVGYFNVVNKLSFAFGALALGALYLFGFFYPVRKAFTKYRRTVLGSGIVLACLAPLTVISGEFVFIEGELQFVYGEFAWLIGLYGVVALAGTVANTLSLYRSTGNRQIKQQATTLLLGLVLTVIHAMLFILLLPTMFGPSPQLYAIGYLAPYYYTAFTAYSLLRQGLFDVRAVVARSAGYAISLISLVLLYFGLVFLISNIFLVEDFSFSEQALLAAVTAGLALTYRSLVPLFNRLTSKLFYRDAYDPQDFIDELNKTLVSTIHLDELLQRSSTLIASTLKTDLCAFILNHKQEHPIIAGIGGERIDSKGVRVVHHYADRVVEPFIITSDLVAEHSEFRHVLNRWKTSLAIRMLDAKHGGEVLGYIVLGDKKSGGIYTMQDIKVMTIVANELVIAVQNALRFQEIENFNVTLQDKVEEATKRLRQSNAKLKMLDQTKDDFISMASHQLRTPLTSVKGYISMVLDGDAGKISSLQRKLLNQSFVSSQRMVYLISDLLNVSRLRTGKFIIEPVPANLATIIEGELDQLVETAKSRNLKLVYEKPEHFPTYMLDETKLRQVIMNFVDNAIYYTPSGGTITVGLTEKSQSIEFTVTDTGMGVPKHDQPHLFTKFFRAHNARRARPDGTGLGLFMAKKVVIAQGGAIIFRSQEGKGSTFGFSFAKDRLHPAP